MKYFITLILVLFQLFCFTQTKQDIDKVNEISHKEIITNLSKSKTLLLQNIAAAKSIQYEKGLAAANSKLAIVYYYLKETDKGYACSIAASKHFEKTKDYNRLAESYADLGYVIKDIDLEKGLLYFRMAIPIVEQHNLDILKEKVYNNYGVLQKLKPNLDSALYYHNKAFEIAVATNNIYGIPYDLNNIVEVCIELNQFDKALEVMDLSDSYRIKENNEMNWADNLAYRADIYYGMQNYDSAIVYYSQALKIAKKTNFQNLTKFCLERISDCYEKENDATQALAYFKELQLHKDSIITIETNKTLATLEEEFDLAKKEKKINEQQIKMLEQRTKIYLGIGTTIFLLIIGGGIFFRQKRKKRTEIEKLQHQKELEKAKLEKEFVEEKLRIGRELHDNIGSQLTFMISSVDNMVFVEKEENKKGRLERISDFGRTTMKELRSTIWAMKNDGGTLEELILKLHELKLRLPENLDLRIKNTTDRAIHFNAMQLLNAYRIVQESLQNIVKYAGAKNISISFSNINNKTLLLIEDDGIGFDTSQLSGGNGLSNMKRRCEECEGSFKIISSNQGTVISCEFLI